MILSDNNKPELIGNELKKYRQKKKILDLLYQNDVLTASFIGREIGVSLPTVLSLLKELGNQNFLEQRGRGQSVGGRRPALFGLKKDSIFMIVCELGRFSGKIGIYDAHNQLVAPVVKFETHIDDKDMVNKIHDAALQIIESNQIDYERIFGVGLAMPGLVDATAGINYTIKDPAFQNVQERLEQCFDKLVYVNNDARMQAYGEYIFGAAKGFCNSLVINWNWGLGLGMILDGKLYNGSTGFAGELSHIKFIEDGELCICGKRGCLETVTSVNVLLSRSRNAIREGKISQLTNRFKDKPDALQEEDIINAAMSGDEFSISLMNQVGENLGKALSNMIHLLNPDIIVLGGVVSRAGRFVLTPIQQSINKYCLEQISENTKIVISEKWEQSGLLGTTAMLFQKLFSDFSN
jgi:N-acetylglucosamine repressor